jgi:hypothetical protein
VHNENNNTTGEADVKQMTVRFGRHGNGKRDWGGADVVGMMMRLKGAGLTV